jgi:hypothetical protein
LLEQLTDKGGDFSFTGDFFFAEVSLPGLCPLLIVKVSSDFWEVCWVHVHQVEKADRLNSCAALLPRPYVAESLDESHRSMRNLRSGLGQSLNVDICGAKLLGSHSEACIELAFLQARLLEQLIDKGSDFSFTGDFFLVRHDHPPRI